MIIWSQQVCKIIGFLLKRRQVFLFPAGGNKITFYSFRNEDSIVNYYPKKKEKRKNRKQLVSTNRLNLNSNNHPICCFDISRDSTMASIFIYYIFAPQITYGYHFLSHRPPSLFNVAFKFGYWTHLNCQRRSKVILQSFLAFTSLRTVNFSLLALRTRRKILGTWKFAFMTSTIFQSHGLGTSIWHFTNYLQST